MIYFDENGGFGFSSREGPVTRDATGIPVRAYPGPFEPVYSAGGKVVTGYDNCYVQLGGFLSGGGHKDFSVVSGYVCIEIPSMELKRYGSVAALKEDQADLSRVILPLFYLENSAVRIDFRRTPYVGIIEPFDTSTPELPGFTNEEDPGLVVS